jgi:hypothetical protein
VSDDLERIKQLEEEQKSLKEKLDETNKRFEETNMRLEINLFMIRFRELQNAERETKENENE